MNRAERRRSQRQARTDRATPHPSNFAEGVSAFRAGDLEGAEAHFRRCLGTGPEGATARFNLGIVMARRHRHDEAIPQFEAALALRPDYAEALINLSLSLFELGRFPESRDAALRLVAMAPGSALHWSTLAQAFTALEDRGGAEQACRQALALDPSFVPALHRMLDLLRNRGDQESSLRCCDALVESDPGSIDLLRMRALVRREAGFEAEANADVERTLELDRSGDRTSLAFDSIMFYTGRPEAAIAILDRFLARAPRNTRALLDRALMHQRAGAFQKALEDLKVCLELTPRDELVHYQFGHLFLVAEQPGTAVEFFLQALRLKPDFLDALFYLALAHVRMEDFTTAEAALDCAIAAAPDRFDLRTELLWCRMHACNWQALSGTLADDIAGSIRTGAVISPFKVMGLGLSSLETLLWTRAWSEKHTPSHPRPVVRAPKPPGSRIRVGYVSADFRNHATAFLVTELFELHDRTRFETFGYSIGRLDDSAIGRRMVTSLDGFVDLSGLSDRDAAQRIADDGIDLLVDLKGYTHESRAAIFAHRPAAIQVNYLGFPSTMGTRDMDYIVVDDVIAPEDHQPSYDERIVRLPNSYQPNVRRTGADPHAKRADHGLPDDGFVFCCFNNTYKITPLFFDIWMRLLAAVPGSVLWLFQANGQAHDHLRREAALRGIAPERLVFAPRLMNDAHLARSGLADLFLDTLPINAHTTASDALWAGVPVLTCLGSYFFGRVAASLLHAVGLPELVAHDLASYESLALDLARDPARLAGLRDRLARNRDTAPLFDTPRYARNFEAALTRMVARHDAGLPPEPFAVADQREAWTAEGSRAAR